MDYDRYQYQDVLFQVFPLELRVSKRRLQRYFFELGSTCLSDYMSVVERCV